MKETMATKRRKAMRNTEATASTSSTSDESDGIGQLKRLLEMPLDVLYEVTGQLYPLDLLHLSRTSKHLRRLVMSRAWSSSWRHALHNDPDMFPGKPEDLSEPVYASFLYDSFCQSCLCEKTDVVTLWSFRQRLCVPCRRDRFLDSYRAQLLWQDALQSDLSTYFDIMAHDVVHYMPTYSREEILRLKQDITNCKDQTAIGIYKRSRLKELELIHKFRDDCRDAYLRRQQRTSRELEEARARRTEAILHRLRALGYSEEVVYLSQHNPRSLNEPADIWSAVPLTDAIFTKILPRLLILMDATRETIMRRKQKRLNGTRLQLLNTILQHYASENTNKVLPSLADLAFTPKIKTILRNKDVNAYSTEDSFADIRADLPKMCKDWRRSKNELLAALLESKGMNISHLSLAVVFFKCQECAEPISYPRILAHQCLRRLRPGYRNFEDKVVTLLTALGEEPWNMDPRNGVQVYEPAIRCAVDVVRGFGMSPEVATSQDMDAMDMQWVECMTCRSTVAKRSVVYQWRSAVLHGLKHLKGGKAAAWALVGRFDDIMAAETADERKVTRAAERGAYNVCVHCHAKVERHVRREHMQLAHETHHFEKIEQQFTLDYDAPLDQQPYVVTIPIIERAATPKRPQMCVDLTEGEDSVIVIED